MKDRGLAFEFKKQCTLVNVQMPDPKTSFVVICEAARC